MADYVMNTIIISLIIIFVIFLLFTIVLKKNGSVDKGPGVLICTVLCIGLSLLCWAYEKCKNDAVIFSSEKLDIYSVDLNAGAFILWKKGNMYLYSTGDSISGFNIKGFPIDRTTIIYTEEEAHLTIDYCNKIICGDTLKIAERIKAYLPHGSIIRNY